MLVVVVSREFSCDSFMKIWCEDVQCLFLQWKGSLELELKLWGDAVPKVFLNIFLPACCRTISLPPENQKALLVMNPSHESKALSGECVCVKERSG